jgi:succinoglycan biosynthesis protein ExoA
MPSPSEGSLTDTAPSAASPLAGPPLSAQPTVSLIVTILNEATYIERALDRLLEQDYPPELIEIVVVDGMSTDGTRQMVAEYIKKDPRIRMVDNPQRVNPIARNIGNAAATGEVIISVDGHTLVARDFVRQSIEALRQHSDAWGVGGPIVHVGEGVFGRAVAAAMGHPAGVGNARHRFAGYEGYGEGTGFPTFYRWVFDKVGGFDERMVRTEDDEFYFRVRKAGGRFFITPKIRYEYVVRSKAKHLWRQYSQYAFWRIPVMRKHRQPTTVRQLAPLLFYALMIVLAVVGAVMRNPYIALTLPAIYLAALATVGLLAIPKHGVRVGLLMPVAIVIMHASYAWGMALGLLAWAFRPSMFELGGSMTKISR